VCVGAISKREYGKIIRDLIKFFEGKKQVILKQYKKDMQAAAKEKRFEDAAELRNKIYFLEHIRDIAILKREDEERTGETAAGLFGRIEGYDISNISGTATTASMVVFENGAPAKAEYRKFRIRTVRGSDDPAAVREALTRRLRNPWRHPDLILIDGGWLQVHAAMQVAHEFHLNIPIVGLAKGAKRKKNELICDPGNLDICRQCEKYKKLLIQVRDEAHRFAIKYHRELRNKKMKGV
jgi:excinuclease ABC subunit C